MIRMCLVIVSLFLLGNSVFAMDETTNQEDSQKCFKVGETIGGVPSPDNVCCATLQLRPDKSWFDKDCKPLPVGGAVGVCIACGDEVCDERYENKCNCPEDCDQGAVTKGN
jgi:hypothetical protein